MSSAPPHPRPFSHPAVSGIGEGSYSKTFFSVSPLALTSPSPSLPAQAGLVRRGIFSFLPLTKGELEGVG